MTLELQTQQNIATTASTTCVVETNSTNSTSTTNVPLNGSGVGENTDTFNTNTSNSSVGKTKRTAKELCNFATSLLKQYGISLSETDTLALLEKIAGCKQEILLNLENSEIQKHLQCLEAALKKLGKNGAEIDINILAELANDYNIAIHTGWSIEGFEKAQSRGQESLKARLERVYPGKSMEEALELYFTAYFDSVIADKIKKANTPEEKENIIKTEKLRQLQDFGKLLANSSEAEKTYFKEAIKSLYTNNKLKGFEALVQSLDSQEARTELVDSCGPNYIEILALKTDRFGNTSDKNEIAGITNLIAREQSLEGRKAFHKEFNEKAVAFFDKNKEAIGLLNEKIKNGEKLTQEEQALRNTILNYYQAVTEGEFTGTAMNVNMEVDEKKDLLSIINSDAYQIGEKAGNDFYRNVLLEVAKYADSLPEGSKEVFKQLMETAIGENYTNISSNPQAELKAPVARTETSAIATLDVPDEIKGSFGYTTKETPANISATTSVATLYQRKTEEAPLVGVIQSSKLEITTSSTIDDYFKAYGGLKGFEKFNKDHGTLVAIRETFNNFSNDTAAMLGAMMSFKGIDCSQQLNVIKGLYTEGLTAALNNAKEGTIKRLQHVTLGTFGATKQARVAAEERHT